MKTSAPKLLLLLSSVAVFSAFTAASTYAAEPGPAADAKAQKRAEKKEADLLKKYDKNANGVLDPDEQAERQANIDRMRGVRDAKKKKGEEQDKKPRE